MTAYLSDTEDLVGDFSHVGDREYFGEEEKSRLLPLIRFGVQYLRFVALLLLWFPISAIYSL